jgi:hypothetical protein
VIEAEVSVKGGRVVVQITDPGGAPVGRPRQWWLDLNPADAADLAHRILHAATEAEHAPIPEEDP